MQGYSHSFVHLLYAIILVQFVLIAILLGGFSSEYLSNDFYRGWINNNYPLIGYLLQGQLDALLIGIALGGTMLLIMALRAERRIEATETSEEHVIITSRSSENASPALSEGTISESVHEDPEDVMSELERHDV